jgi:hypothetical protein
MSAAPITSGAESLNSREFMDQLQLYTTHSHEILNPESGARLTPAGLCR